MTNGDEVLGSEKDVESDSNASFSTTESAGTSEPLNLYYYQIIYLINKLFDISILIRRASRKFRTSRAATHVEKDEDGNDILAEFRTIVRLRIEHLWPETPQWLVERLVDVVGKRRQQFYYQRAHKKRLERVPTAFDQEQSVSTPANPITVSKVSSPPQLEVQEPTQLPAPPKTIKSGGTWKTTTTASEILPPDGQKSIEMQLRPTRTEIGRGQGTFPKPPKSTGYAFECSQCFSILPDETREPTLWTSTPALILD